MRILTVVCARPQLIKAAVVSHALKAAEGVSELIVHTEQHYDSSLSDVFFDELEIPRLDYNLEVVSGNHGYQTGRMLEKIEELLLEIKSDCVLVYGDTNSTLAGALAAVKLSIPLAHVETGLRSFNRKMPEEINRVLTDHSSDFLFAPTETAVSNLRREGIPENKIHLVGDVMYDAALFYAEKALKVKADVYHFHDPELIHIGVLLKLFTRKKVIYDVHELVYFQIEDKEWLQYQVVKKTLQLIYLLFERLSIRIFNKIILAESKYEDWFRRHHKKFFNYIIIRNLPILKLIDNIKFERDKRNKPGIIYVGGLTRIRGIKEIIQAMLYVNDKTELWLLGKWENNKFKKECENEKGWKHTKYLGLVLLEEVFQYMKIADIGISMFHPVKSYLTGLPVKVFEYMACSLPMVMSDFPYFRKFFKECAVFADPFDSKDIAEKILYLLDNPNEAKELGKKGRKLIEEKCNWKVESQKLLNMYKNL